MYQDLLRSLRERTSKLSQDIHVRFAGKDQHGMLALKLFPADFHDEQLDIAFNEVAALHELSFCVNAKRYSSPNTFGGYPSPIVDPPIAAGQKFGPCKAASGEGALYVESKSEIYGPLMTSPGNIRFKMDEFKAWLSELTLSIDGDRRELAFVAIKELFRSFRNYENLWKIAIAPLTNRVEYYPGLPSMDIDFRPGISADLMTMAQYHYSIMRSLVFAYEHSKGVLDSSYQDFFMHLVNACEQVQLFLFAWLVCIEKSLTWEDIERRTKKLRSENEREDLLVEELPFLRSQLQQFKSSHHQAKVARNILVHGPQLYQARKGEEVLVLRVAALKKYAEWYEAKGAPERKIDKALVSQQAEMRENLLNVARKIDALWAPLVTTFIEKLEGDPVLQATYGLELVPHLHDPDDTE